LLTIAYSICLVVSLVYGIITFISFVVGSVLIFVLTPMVDKWFNDRTKSNRQKEIERLSAKLEKLKRATS
jgi:archaellum biogenesis protein FlaJ (TadC family)